jgi:hypothetical protein
VDCPACKTAMDAPSFERPYGQRVTIDVCRRCQCLWFDDQEFLQLTAGATLELVASVADDRAVTRGPWSSAVRCPRCHLRLAETHDIQRSTRFTYHRCPAGHGRLLTYYQFLRAKNFVRPLSEEEVRELRAHIQQINCANCGAPVNVERNAVCGFCRTPLAIIDPDQVKKTLGELKAAAEEKKSVDPALPVTLALERLRIERMSAGMDPEGRRSVVHDVLFDDASDPVIGFLRLLGRLRG